MHVHCGEDGLFPRELRPWTHHVLGSLHSFAICTPGRLLQPAMQCLVKLACLPSCYTVRCGRHRMCGEES